MKLTKKKAINITIELWEWLAWTGGDILDKVTWSGWEKYDEMRGACPLCEYSGRKSKLETLQDCLKCPLFVQLREDCFALGYDVWHRAETVEDRKKYAKLFLEQLRKL